MGIALAPDGKAYVSDRQRDAILRLDLASGVLTVVANLIEPRGLAMDNAGKLIVADGRALRRVDPGTGAVTTVAEGAPLDQPRDVAVQLDGTLYAVGERQVVRVDPASGAKTVLASGGLLIYPSAIDIDPDGDLVVSERGGVGRVLHVDRETGATRLLSNGQLLAEPTGVATVGGAGVDASGGGNGDPDGPAAPPDPPVDPGDPGDPGVPGAPGSPGRSWRSGPGGITVRLPNGTVITLPPGVTPATSGIRGVDFAAPSFVRKPKLSATRFRAARRGRAFVSAFPIGTSLSWLLNEPARVTVTVQKYRHLSRVCRRKLAKQSRHRTGTRCRKWVSVKGRYSKASLAGISSVRFRGRLNKKTLKPGRYRFVIRARDGAGNVSKPRRPGFRIVR